jgi:hypothetical protein
LSELDFVHNVAAGVDSLGVEYTPIIYALAKVNWESVEDRDAVFSWMGEDVD